MANNPGKRGPKKSWHPPFLSRTKPATPQISLPTSVTHMSSSGKKLPFATIDLDVAKRQLLQQDRVDDQPPPPPHPSGSQNRFPSGPSITVQPAPPQPPLPPSAPSQPQLPQQPQQQLPPKSSSSSQNGLGPRPRSAAGSGLRPPPPPAHQPGNDGNQGLKPSVSIRRYSTRFNPAGPRGMPTGSVTSSARVQAKMEHFQDPDFDPSTYVNSILAGAEESGMVTTDDISTLRKQLVELRTQTSAVFQSNAYHKRHQFIEIGLEVDKVSREMHALRALLVDLNRIVEATVTSSEFAAGPTTGSRRGSIADLNAIWNSHLEGLRKSTSKRHGSGRTDILDSFGAGSLGKSQTAIENAISLLFDTQDDGRSKLLSQLTQASDQRATIADDALTSGPAMPAQLAALASLVADNRVDSSTSLSAYFGPYIRVGTEDVPVRKLDSTIDELEVAVAIHDFETAVELAERLRTQAHEVRDNRLAQDVFAAMVNVRVKKLVSTLIQRLVAEHAQEEEVGQMVDWLLQLNCAAEAREAFLAARGERLEKRVRQCTFDGDFPRYVFQLSFIYFSLIRDTIELYQASFVVGTPTCMSICINWAQQHTVELVNLLQRQFKALASSTDVSSPDKVDEIWRICAQNVWKHSKLLNPVQVDFSSLLVPINNFSSRSAASRRG